MVYLSNFLFSLFICLIFAYGDATFKVLSTEKKTISNSLYKDISKKAYVSGQSFYFAVINSHLNANDVSYTENITVFIANDAASDAQVAITSPFMSLPNNQFTVSANSTYAYSMPPEIQTNYKHVENNMVLVSNKSIWLTAQGAPVSVTVRNAHSDAQSEDDYVIYPVCSLGNSYHTVGDESAWHGMNSTNMWSIVATQDNTVVTISPSLNVPPITLSAGQVLTFSSTFYPMSNYRVLSTAPVAVISGSTCGFGYFNPSLCNHEAVMLFPMGDSGNSFPYSQFLSEDEGEIMCFVENNGTIISFDGIPYARLSVIDYLLIRVLGDVFVTFDKPGYVIAIGSARSNGTGSPFMAHIPSSDQFTNKKSIQAQTGLVGRNIAKHFVRIQSDLDNIGQVAVNGWTINPLYYQRQGLSIFFYADWPVSAGNIRITSSGKGKYAATVYGYAPLTAYAYTPGIDLPTNGTC